MLLNYLSLRAEQYSKGKKEEYKITILFNFKCIQIRSKCLI